MRVRMEPGPMPRPFQSHNPHSLFLFNTCLLGSSFLKSRFSARTPWLACRVCKETWPVEGPKGMQWPKLTLTMCTMPLPWPYFLSFIIRHRPMWCRQQIPKEMERHLMLSTLRENILCQAQAINKLFTVYAASLMLHYLRNRGRI